MGTMQQQVPFRHGGFIPAPTLRLKGEGQSQQQEEDEELVSLNEEQSNHFTKDGKPDHRFKENRAFSDEPVNPEYRHARTASVINGTHVTMTGKPDRRYKENRSMSDDEAEILGAQAILAKYQR